MTRVQSQPRLEILSQKIKLKLRILRMETHILCVKNLKIFLKLSLNSYTGNTPNVGFCGTLRTPNVAFLIRGKDEVDPQKAPTNGLNQNLQSLGDP